MRSGLLAIFLVPVFATAADPLKIDRTIGKEPKYAGQPKYCLVAFDAEGKERLWLVHDGDSLYVDRNGNGDLTDDGEKITAEKPKVTPADGSKSYHFDVGEVTIAGKTHKGLTVYGESLKRYAPADAGKWAYVQAALKKEAETLCYMVRIESERTGVKGGSSDGRVAYSVGPFDLTGVLQFAATRDNAPVIHLGAPLQVTFYAQTTKMRAGRTSDFTLCVGAPGVGPGTLAMLAYEGTIPESAHPVAEILYPGDKPEKQSVELKQRC